MEDELDGEEEVEDVEGEEDEDDEDIPEDDLDEAEGWYFKLLLARLILLLCYTEEKSIFLNFKNQTLFFKYTILILFLKTPPGINNII